MKFNSVKRNNFSGLAKSVNRSADQIFNAARESAVDNTLIAKEAIKGRSMERRAAMKADAAVAEAGLKAATKVNLTKLKIETDEAVADIKRPAKRMAGIVGGLGALTGGLVSSAENKKARAEADELKAMRMDNINRQEARDAERDAREDKILQGLFGNNGNAGGSGGDGSSSNTDTASPTQTQPLPITVLPRFLVN